MAVRGAAAAGLAAAARRSSLAPRPGGRGRVLVRLTKADVYLDEHRALSGITLTIRRGECWVVHGPNGSGKSSLIRTLYGDHGVAAGGRIERAGIVPGVPLETFKRTVGLVAPHLQADHPRDLTVAAVVQSGLHASIGLVDAPSAAEQASARTALAFFGMQRFASRPVAELSYGQLRRVLFARAWVGNPPLLLLDEPYSGVDASTRHGLMRHLDELIAAGTTVVIATHNREEWPAGATHELALSKGSPVWCGPYPMTSISQTAAPRRAPSLNALFVVSMIDVLGFGVLIPLVPYMAQRYGAGPSLTTAILGSYSLCQLLAAPVWGRLSDRYGRRPILMSSLVGACLSYVIWPWPTVCGCCSRRACSPASWPGTCAAAFAYASDVSTPATRAKSMGMVGAAIGIGFMLGIPFGGILAGDHAQSANFLRPALASALLSLVALALVKFRLPESRVGQPDPVIGETLPARVSAQAFRRGAGPLALLRQRPRLLYIAAAALLVTTAQGILESIFALWALHRFGAGPRSVAYALFGAAIVAVIMQGGLVRVLAPRLGERRLAQLGIAVLCRRAAVRRTRG